MAIHFKHSDPEISILKNNGIEYLFTGILACLVYLIAVYTYGPGITNDSIDYISASLTLNEGMKKADGTPFSEWPPLYPITLSLSGLLKINVLKFVQVLHGIAFIINIFLTQKLLKTNLKSKEIYIPSLFFLLFSLPLLQMHVMLWSEPVFISLALINLFALKNYLTDNSKVNLLILIILGILMYLQRKTGIYFIINTAAVILFYKYKSRRIIKTIHSAIYGFLCFIPVILWQKRGLEISGNLLGDTNFEPGKLFVNIEQSLKTFSTWFLPHTIPLFARIIILSVILTFIIIIAYRNKSIYKELANNIIFNCCLINLILFILILTASITYVKLDEEIDDRILSSVYLPVLISFFILADKIYFHAAEKVFHKKVIIIGLFLLILYPAFRTFYHIRRWNTSGTGGYNSFMWKENQILTILYSENFNTDTIYTNNTYAMKYYLNYKRETSYKIFPQNEFMKNGALHICFEKGWNYPGKECLDGCQEKNVIIKNKDGKICQLTNL